MKIIRAADLEEDFFNYRDIEETAKVKKVLKDVRQFGDAAVKRYTHKFDGVLLTKLGIGLMERKNAYTKVDKKVIGAIGRAATNIKRFSRQQMNRLEDFESEIAPGVFCGQRITPIERIGIYAPGGRFPLVSTLLMCAIPAQVAGVNEIMVCSPPSCDGSIHPAMLVAADIAAVNEIYKIGGAQAIGAMAYGTETIRKVDKIVGPGNKYVTQAKKEVYGTVGIDFIAGPTEIMIIADETAKPEIVAADLLAQAEHDVEAIPLLITDSLKLALAVQKEVVCQMKRLRTKDVAKRSMSRNGRIVLVRDLDKAIEIAQRRAPEHLELQLRNPQSYVGRLKNFGSLFFGENAAEVLGDYSSGLNHVLPTNLAARYTGGLSVRDFIKVQTTLRVTKKGLSKIGSVARILAETEGMNAHAKSIRIRLGQSAQHGIM